MKFEINDLLKIYLNIICSKENGKCPVDSVSLSHENIFPDNYTRREIMACMAKCPYSTKDNLGCTIVLPIAELEKHIQTEHARLNGLPGSFSPSASNGLLECPYKEVGCAIPLRQDQLSRHLEMNVHLHLQLLTASYKRLKIYSSRSNLEFPEFLRQDSRDSTRWLLDESPDDYQFRRQRSWDSVRFARKHNIRPSTSNLNSQSAAWLPESEESLCHQPPQPSHSLQHHRQRHPSRREESSANPEKGKVNGNGGFGEGVDPHLQDIFQRLVLLEQKDREKQIKIDKLQAELSKVGRLVDTSARFFKDFTTRHCHGVYVWQITDFRKLCTDMRRNPNRVLNSPGFYTDPFGYRLGMRFNLSTPPAPMALGATGGAPVGVPLEQDEDTFISLYVHFMQGEFDDVLNWPFHGEFKLMIVHPTIPEDTMIEILYSKPEAATFAKPTLARNPKGFGYLEFCPIHKIFSNGFVMNDMLVCKILAKSNNYIE